VTDSKPPSQFENDLDSKERIRLMVVIINMKNISIVSTIIFFILGSSIVLVAFFQESQSASWARSEMYFSVILNILFLVVLSGTFYKYLNDKDKVLKYVMSIALTASLTFYCYASLSYDSAFPTLAALNVITVLYLIPGLLLVRTSVAMIRKIASKHN
jgi:amino acid transporter